MINLNENSINIMNKIKIMFFILIKNYIYKTVRIYKIVSVNKYTRRTIVTNIKLLYINIKKIEEK